MLLIPPDARSSLPSRCLCFPFSTRLFSITLEIGLSVSGALVQIDAERTWPPFFRVLSCKIGSESDLLDDICV